MTGFGRVRAIFDGKTFEILVSSLNHRFIEVFTSLPEGFEELEVPIRKVVSEKLKRGKIMVKVSISKRDLAGNRDIKEFLKTAQIFNKKSGYYIKPTISDFLLFMKERCGMEKILGGKERRNFEKILLKAIKRVDEMRKREGRKIKREIKKSMEIIDKSIKKIGNLKRRIERALMKKLSKDPDKEKIIKEKDFSEEFSRLCSHFSLLKKVIEGDEVGKKILFIQQEMLRETTTLANKAGDFEISFLSIEIKNELEKIREHAQNIL